MIFTLVIDPVLCLASKLNTAPYVFRHPSMDQEAEDGVRAFADDTAAMCIQLALFLVLIRQISHAFYTVGLLLNMTKIVIMFSEAAARQTGKEVFTIPLYYDAQGKPSVGKKGEPLVVTFRPLELMDDPERYLGVHFNYRGST